MGEYDPDGKYKKLIIAQLNVKYQKEACLCLGVASVVENNNTNNNTNAENNNQLVGKQLALIFYSNKVILLIKNWKKKEVQENARVKRLEKILFGVL
jgi:hypothetical protein